MGWVGVWRSVEPLGISPFTLALGLVVAFGVVYAVHLARPPEAARRRWAGALLASVAMAGLAGQFSAEAHEAAPPLNRRGAYSGAAALVEIAGSIPRVPQSQLARVAPSARIRFLRGVAAPRAVLREVIDGERRAVVRVPLRSGSVMELSVIPRESRLDPLTAALGGWVLLLGMSLAFAAWSAGAQRDRAGFRESLAAGGFLGPALGHLALFAFGPMVFAGWLALHKWGLTEQAQPFVGLDNFRQVLGDRQFWHSLRVTAVYTLYVPVAMALALAAAVALDRSGLRVRLLRAVLFLPFISSVVAVALVWQWMYQADFGLINAGLARLGIRGPDWLGDPRFALAAVMVMSAWAQLGYQMVLFLAGLQAIPSVYLDAARVDGAGAWQRFRHVTLPLLRPTILFVLVTGTISSFQVFTYISVMTEGGPLYATDVVVYRIYQEAWEFLRFGTASAMSLVLLVVLLGLTWVQFRWLGKRVEIS